MFNVDKWDTSADYLVIDDMPFENIHAVKSVLGGGGEWEDTGKFRSTKTVKWYKLCTIWLANRGPDEDPRYHQKYKNMQEWIDKNIVIVELNIGEKMY